MTIGDNLTYFRANEPLMGRVAWTLGMVAALMLAVTVTYQYTENVATAEERKAAKIKAAPQAHESPASPPVTVSHEPAAAAPLGKCQHLVRGQWLYWAIEHRGDRMEFHHCEYMDWRGKP